MLKHKNTSNVSYFSKAKQEQPCNLKPHVKPCEVEPQVHKCQNRTI